MKNQNTLKNLLNQLAIITILGASIDPLIGSEACAEIEAMQADVKHRIRLQLKYRNCDPLEKSLLEGRKRYCHHNGYEYAFWYETGDCVYWDDDRVTEFLENENGDFFTDVFWKRTKYGVRVITKYDGERTMDFYI